VWAYVCMYRRKTGFHFVSGSAMLINKSSEN
jgi:hypothetical protein